MDSRRLLVSDLDGTLLGDPAGLARFGRWLRRRRAGYALAYASGRLPASIHAAIVDEGLPNPDAIISSVGTEIHDGAGRPWPGWPERFDRTHGARVRAALRPLRWLEFQPAENQTDLKASFDVRGLTPSDRGLIRRALADAGIAAGLVYSAGLHLDVIPLLAGKGAAARFLAGSLGIADRDVLAFGDSGNDLDLLAAGFRGTVVANALPELVDRVPADVYRSARPFADGILDGIRFWSRS